jgi:acetylornithine/N-succinyldiaminopimelate aminotransferase
MAEQRYVVPMGPIDKKSFYDFEVKEGNGPYLICADGKKYLDLRSGLWNVSLGYNKELNERVSLSFETLLKKQIPFVDISSYNHPLYQEYSEQLLDFMNAGHSNPFSKVFYTNSGSEGAELITKLVRHVCGSKKKIVTFDKSYHGTFYAGISANGIEKDITMPYSPKVEGFLNVKTPRTEEEEDQFLMYLADHHKSIGAILFEPVIGSGGVFAFRQEFLLSLKELLDRYSILLIFDEVATGFYRTGHRFAFHELGVIPDIIILSKGINNGILPMGAVVITEELQRQFECNKTYIEHFSTQNGNLLGIVSALETLRYYQEKEDIIAKNVREIEKTVKETPFTRTNVFGKGAMFSIPVNNQMRTVSIVKELKDLGILTYFYINNQEDNGLTIFPPLLVDISILKKAMKMIARRV